MEAKYPIDVDKDKLGLLNLFGNGGITTDGKNIKFWVGDPDPDVDSDIYLDADTLTELAADLLEIVRQMKIEQKQAKGSPFLADT